MNSKQYNQLNDELKIMDSNALTLI